VLCAIDLGRQSCPALTLAGRLAEDFDASLTVVHALPAVHATAAVGADQDWRVEIARDARARIEKLQDATGTHADVIIGTDEPPRVVHDAAAKVHASLVVIGRSVRQGVLGRLRANAYSIIRQSPCPVISV